MKKVDTKTIDPNSENFTLCDQKSDECGEHRNTLEDVLTDALSYTKRFINTSNCSKDNLECANKIAHEYEKSIEVLNPRIGYKRSKKIIYNCGTINNELNKTHRGGESSLSEFCDNIRAYNAKCLEALEMYHAADLEFTRTMRAITESSPI